MKTIKKTEGVKKSRLSVRELLAAARRVEAEAMLAFQAASKLHDRAGSIASALGVKAALKEWMDAGDCVDALQALVDAGPRGGVGVRRTG